MSQDLAGLRIVITGANTGVGRVAAESLAGRGASLILAGRSRERTQPVLDTIAAGRGHASFIELDLGSLASVRKATDAILATGEPIDVLMNNAGLAGQPGQTVDGFEKTFGVNHLGPFLFTERLLPLLGKGTSPSRVVNVASGSHYQAKAIDWEALRRPTATRTALPEYAVSKLCNVLHAVELDERLRDRNITTYALHPGTVATDVWRAIPSPIAWLMKRFMLTPEQGAATQIHCAVSGEAGKESGLYYDRSAPRRPSRLARDPELARELRRRSLEWVGGHLA